MMGGKRAWFGWGSLVLVGSGAEMSCGPRVNDEHCVFHQGDRGCGELERCIVATGGGVVPGGRHGCLDDASAHFLDDTQWVHVRYGLPRALEAEGEVLGSDSVQGILARIQREQGLPEACSVEQGLPEWLLGSMAVEQILSARERLDELRKKRRIRDEQAYLDGDEADAVKAFEAEVDAWAQACGPEASGTDGSTRPSRSSGHALEVPCQSSDDCREPTTPICGDNEMCVGCDEVVDSDHACAVNDPMRPVCQGASCVECTTNADERCREQSLVCDQDVNQCVLCADHDQCGYAACDFFTGLCFPEDAVMRVGPSQQFASISEAVDLVEVGEQWTIIIHHGSYDEAVIVDGERNLALLAADDEVADWYSSDGPQLMVLDGSVIAEGLRMVGNSTYPGLQVQGGAAWVDRSYVVQNEFGVRTFGANLVMRNCMIGTLVGANSAVEIYSSAVSILSSTLVGGGALSAGAAIECSKSSIVFVRNSILVNYAGVSTLCPGAQVSYSATTAPFDNDMDNVSVGSVSNGWFVDGLSGDFHLHNDGALVFDGVAQWQTGDPATDIDGDPRPSVDGSPDYAGADVP